MSKSPESKVASRLGGEVVDGQVKVTGTSMLASLGGLVGIIESLVPGTVYVTLYSLTLNVLLSATVAGTISIGFAIYQLIRKRPLTQVLAGVVGLAISIYLPLRDGLNDTHAADYFVPGLLTNLGYASVFGLSILLRMPIAGVAISFLNGTGKIWRQDKVLFKRYTWITTMWFAMFCIRLAIELPFYWSGQVAALGIAKLVLGTPFYALILWFTWLAAKPTLTSK